MTTTVVREVIPIRRHEKIEGHYWLEVAIADSDEAMTYTKKILEFEGREYGWSCWNSDRMVVVFKSPPWPHATIKRKA